MELSLLFGIFMFIQVSHPVRMGIVVCISSIPVIILIGHFFINFWFRYLSFLVLLGAILVLFMYVRSLVSNEIFSLISMKSWIINFFIIYFIFYAFSLNLFELHLVFDIGELFNENYYEIIGFLICYLLLTLLVIVKLVQLFKGPLREIT